MDIAQIETLPIEAHMSDQVKNLRKNAPQYIKSLIEDSYAVQEFKSLEEIGQDNLHVLSGGMLSAVYYLNQGEKHMIIKFRYRGVKAEAESLKAWKKQGANVVEVKNWGIVPQTRMSKEKVYYIILETVTNRKGQISQTCASYAKEHPESLSTIGKVLGEELAKVHKAKTSRTFGEFADMWGKNKSPIKTWNNYLVGYIDSHYDFLIKQGFTNSRIKLIKEKIMAMKFPKRGVFVHGDYSMRNAMIESLKPFHVKIFDPNPLIGDPSWDLAILFNNYEFEKRKYAFNPKKKAFKESFSIEEQFFPAFKTSYEIATRKKINTDKIKLAQMMQLTFLLEIEENKALKRGENPTDAIEVMVRKDTLLAKAVEVVNISVKI